jgi:hypothetical protein
MEVGYILFGVDYSWKKAALDWSLSGFSLVLLSE